MKFWSILILMIFINSIAFPGIAKFMDIDIPTSNIVITEEETHVAGFQLSEKEIPNTLDVHEFLKFFKTDSHKKQYMAYNENKSISPYISIVSPPPEVL